MNDEPDLKVVPLFDKAVAADIVGSLRRAADSIEDETEDDERVITAMFVTIGEEGAVRVYGWGKINGRLEAMGILAAGIAKL